MTNDQKQANFRGQLLNPINLKDYILSHYFVLDAIIESVLIFAFLWGLAPVLDILLGVDSSKYEHAETAAMVWGTRVACMYADRLKGKRMFSGLQLPTYLLLFSSATAAIFIAEIAGVPKDNLFHLAGVKFLTSLLVSVLILVFLSDLWKDEGYEIASFVGKKINPEREKYFRRWISQIMSDSVFESTFDHWMGHFKSRYTAGDLVVLRKEFDKRKRSLEESR